MDDLTPPAIKADARQPTACIGPGVDGNTIVMDFDGIDNRVSVDDHNAVIAIRLRELASDKQQILFILAVQPHPGSYPCVNKQIITATEGQRRLFQHGHVVRGHGCRDPLAEVDAVLIRARRSDAEIGQECLAAISQPYLLRGGMACDALQQQILVVSPQQMDARMRNQIMRQPQAQGTVRPAIDDIAQQYHFDPIEVAGTVVPMTNNCSDEFTKQVVPPVNITDRVDSFALTGARLLESLA